MHKKKYITIILIVIILFNALIITPSYAFDIGDLFKSNPNFQGVQGQNFIDQYSKDGTASAGKSKWATIEGKNVLVSEEQEAKSTALNPEQDSLIAKLIAGLVRGCAAIIVYSLDWLAKMVSGDLTAETFQIEKIVFNEYKLFDINFFSSNNGTGVTSSIIGQLKSNIAAWYYGIRIIAVLASLCVLIYIAIKMALSTIGDKPKYKKMLSYWLMSMVILFMLHYLIMIMIYTSDMLVELLKHASGGVGIENNLRKELFSNEYSGWNALGMAVMLLILVYLQLKFFLIYLKRLIVTGFLIMISPLITITYAIDRAGDNVAQAFKSWKQEMITLVFIQPLHALLFIIFAVSAGEIAKFSMFIAILLLWSISKGETILRSIFKLTGGSSIKTLGDKMS